MDKLKTQVICGALPRANVVPKLEARKASKINE
jgi:hypothetical protein